MLLGPGKASEMRRFGLFRETSIPVVFLSVGGKRLLFWQVINPFSEYQWISQPYPSYNMPRVPTAEWCLQPEARFFMDVSRFFLKCCFMVFYCFYVDRLPMMLDLTGLLL